MLPLLKRTLVHNVDIIVHRDLSMDFCTILQVKLVMRTCYPTYNRSDKTTLTLEYRWFVAALELRE